MMRAEAWVTECLQSAGLVSEPFGHILSLVQVMGCIVSTLQMGILRRGQVKSITESKGASKGPSQDSDLGGRSPEPSTPSIWSKEVDWRKESLSAEIID